MQPAHFDALTRDLVARRASHRQVRGALVAGFLGVAMTEPAAGAGPHPAPGNGNGQGRNKNKCKVTADCDSCEVCDHHVCVSCQSAGKCCGSGQCIDPSQCAGGCCTDGSCGCSLGRVCNLATRTSSATSAAPTPIVRPGRPARATSAWFPNRPARRIPTA